jgi:pilus assembly protein CpaF
MTPIWGRRALPPPAAGRLEQVVEMAREMLVEDDLVPPDEFHRRLDEWFASAGLQGELRAGLVDSTAAELLGTGPLECFLDDPTVTEIMVNGTDPIWIEKDGMLHQTTARFRSVDAVRGALERLLSGSGRRTDEASPTVDARLDDGSRLNAVLPPVAPSGPLLTIRRPAAQRLTLRDLVASRSVSRPMAAFLHAAVIGRANILVTGAAGAGKTTLLAALAALVPANQRIVVVEDTAELNIEHPNVAAQQCRPGDVEGLPEVSMRDLVRNSLRMRPDRIIVGEVRGGEAAEMVQAMATGHAGSLATVHASSATEALLRLQAMLATAWPGVDAGTLRQWIGVAIDVIVHCARDATGMRTVTTVAAIEQGLSDDVGVITVFAGAEPYQRPERCLQRLAAHGVDLPARLFEPLAS